MAGGSGGSGGPIPPNDTQRALALDFIAQFGHEWRWCIDSKRWYRYRPTGIWTEDETILSVIGDFLAARARQILATVTGPTALQRVYSLESSGTMRCVEGLLKCHPQMVVEEKDFDAEPHLLNTPAFVVNLKTGQFIAHDPAMLMRQQTSCSPSFEAWMPMDQLENPVAIEEHFKRWMPRFLFTLKNLDGTNHQETGYRDWFTPLVGGIYGYIIIGEIRHAGIFFLEGAPGIGKTQIWELLYLILGTYAEQVYADFISKNGEGHRFDMGRTAGKRMLFLDETLLGMMYDEARLSLLASGSTLTVEIKFGRDSVKFPNRAKLCISGNHRPHFVSGEAGGLVSRLMTIEGKGQCIRGGPNDIHQVCKLIAEEEGPAVLSWAIQNAIKDYQEDGHQRFHRLMEPAKAATKEYTRQDSTLVQWVEEHTHLDASLDADLIDLHKHFAAFAKERNDPQRLRPQDFKKVLMLTYPELGEGKRGRPNIGRVYIKGISFRPPTDTTGKVVEFPTMVKP